MYDLIYAGTDIRNFVKGKYPTAKLADASDDIHAERFEFVSDIEEEEFYIFALR